MPAVRVIALAALLFGACTAVDHHALGGAAARDGEDGGFPSDAGDAICCQHHAAALDASLASCDERLCRRLFPPPGHHAGSPGQR